MVGQGMVKNYWPDAKCAKAFWSQQEVRPYRQLLADTLAWCAPNRGEKWLDLGCGSGPLSRGLWERTGGGIEILALDCAPANAEAYDQLNDQLDPPPGDRIQFRCHDFSHGLDLPDRSFDHAVSGLSISYAESYSESLDAWTDEGYDRILREVNRVLRPGGRFVFSVNVPEPKWWWVGLWSIGDVFRTGRPLRFLKRSSRMMRYGAWLKREARVGRFQYLPAEAVAAKLRVAGFERVEWRKSYAGQAFIFRAGRPEAG